MFAAATQTPIRQEAEFSVSPTRKVGAVCAGEEAKCQCYISIESGAALCKVLFKPEDYLPITCVCIIYNVPRLKTSISLHVFFGRRPAGFSSGSVCLQRDLVTAVAPRFPNKTTKNVTVRYISKVYYYENLVPASFSCTSSDWGSLTKPLKINQSFIKLLGHTGVTSTPALSLLLSGAQMWRTGLTLPVATGANNPCISSQKMKLCSHTKALTHSTFFRSSGASLVRPLNFIPSARLNKS